jgi:hypothetical protein
MLKIAEIILRHGAEFAFPTQTLHMAPAQGSLPEPGPHPLREPEGQV